ncbi:MAG: hypothetical protein IKA87_03785 [Lentisphaeria bacterium]|nr:hypothetical protein [Lentisphaeria bacterium]
MRTLEESLLLALEWLSGPGMVKDNTPVGELGRAFGYSFWNGAIRGEYLSREKKWESFCPIWHTGQAVKAFVMAAEALEEKKYLEYAVSGAEFILAQQESSGADAGLIKAYEVEAGSVNTSAILEALDGLFMLSDAVGNKRYEDAAVRALEWVTTHAWQEDLGKFLDIYSPEKRQFLMDNPGSQTRPLLDDAVFLKGWRRSGNEKFRNIALAVAENLLKEENPAGNWIKYIPCNEKNGNIHPRHAYWWGLPMLELFHETGDERFFAVFKRAVDWYRQAIRRDGGLFRDTYTDFSTPSFGHAASGSACAAVMFETYYHETGDDSVLKLIEKTEDFCMMMQLTAPGDTSLKGAILEKVCYPDGSDNIPFLMRDLGSIFFIQAAAKTLMRKKEHLKNEIC